ncbi:MAG: S8 family serine peptidase, partial [bacterium]|nr:S8 family serine peptidase [bacterium]
MQLLKEQYSLSGDGVTIIIKDDFSTGANGSNHGNLVQWCAQDIAENAIFTQSNGYTFEPIEIIEGDSPLILNWCVGPIDFYNTCKIIENGILNKVYGFYLDLAKQGASIVFASGNESCMIGHDNMSTSRLLIAQAINSDESIPGYVYFVGASTVSKQNEIEISYSNLAGLVYNSYVLISQEQFDVGEDTRQEGSSLAAPFFSGFLALLLKIRPDLTAKQVARVIFETAKKLEPSQNLISESLAYLGADANKEENPFPPEFFRGQGLVAPLGAHDRLMSEESIEPWIGGLPDDYAEKLGNYQFSYVHHIMCSTRSQYQGVTLRDLLIKGVYKDFLYHSLSHLPVSQEAFKKYTSDLSDASLVRKAECQWSSKIEPHGRAKLSHF